MVPEFFRGGRGSLGLFRVGRISFDLKNRLIRAVVSTVSRRVLSPDMLYWLTGRMHALRSTGSPVRRWLTRQRGSACDRLCGWMGTWWRSMRGSDPRRRPRSVRWSSWRSPWGSGAFRATGGGGCSAAQSGRAHGALRTTACGRTSLGDARTVTVRAGGVVLIGSPPPP